MIRDPIRSRIRAIARAGLVARLKATRIELAAINKVIARPDPPEAVIARARELIRRLRWAWETLLALGDAEEATLH
jgi:hypothetical protein